MSCDCLRSARRRLGPPVVRLPASLVPPVRQSRGGCPGCCRASRAGTDRAARATLCRRLPAFETPPPTQVRRTQAKGSGEGEEHLLHLLLGHRGVTVLSGQALAHVRWLIAIGIAVFRYHLYDIEVVINKTLVYGSLAVFITGVYVAIVVGIGSLAQRGASRAWPCRSRRRRWWRPRSRHGNGSSASPTGWSMVGGPRRMGRRGFRGAHGGSLRGEELLPRMARILAEGAGATRADVWLRAGHPTMLTSARASARATAASWGTTSVQSRPDSIMEMRYPGEPGLGCGGPGEHLARPRRRRSRLPGRPVPSPEYPRGYYGTKRRVAAGPEAAGEGVRRDENLHDAPARPVTGRGYTHGGNWNYRSGTLPCAGRRRVFPPGQGRE